MTGEATTGSRLNRMESLSPSLLNTVYSEAGWFGVIFPVSRQTIDTTCFFTFSDIPKSPVNFNANFKFTTLLTF